MFIGWICIPIFFIFADMFIGWIFIPIVYLFLKTCLLVESSSQLSIYFLVMFIGWIFIPIIYLFFSHVYWLNIYSDYLFMF